MSLALIRVTSASERNIMNTDLNNLQLPKVDTKLEKLRMVIVGIFDESKDIADNKVLVFCTFRATIRYLKYELQKVFPDTFIDSITGEDDIDARDEKRKQFVVNTKKNILICSEVVSEGLDFQSCHYLVNYDMPWNPAKLEQRVGRLDRIGQKSEIIKIINLVNKYTIEDHVMAKLFERVKLFNSTIGPLSALLSRYQKEFTSDLLRVKRTQAEKEKYEEMILSNVDESSRRQVEFEEKQTEVFGAMDYFFDEKREKNTYFKENEIKFIWEYFIDEYKKSNQLGIKISSSNDIFSMEVGAGTGDMLLMLTEKGISRQFNKKKKDEYDKKIHILRERKKPICFTFNHKCALENLSIEYLNISHPFIQGVLQFLKNTYRQKKTLLVYYANTKKLPIGNYIIFVYRFYVVNCKDSEREFVEERYYTYDLDRSSGNWEIGMGLFNAIITEEPKQGLGVGIKDVLEKIKYLLKKEKNEMAQTILDEFRHVYKTKLNILRLAIINHYTSGIMSIKDNLQFVHDPISREKSKREIVDLEDQKKYKIEQLENRDLRVDIKCTGILYIVNKEVTDD
jgi:SNF2 family DNA or RNA helicase